MTIMNDDSTAWDCDPFFVPCNEPYDLDLNDEDESDWQVIALDRFGDRLVRGD